MKKYILMGIIALFTVSAGFGQSGTFNSIKINGYQITGVSDDSTLANQNSAKLLTEAAAKKLVAGRNANILAAIPDVSNYVVRPGITWTSRTSAASLIWTNVCYGNGLFVAVAGDYPSSTNKIMTSSDGINWTIRNASADNRWYGLCYGNGLFVATSITGSGNRVMTSPDGITWTSRTSASDSYWGSVCYGNGLFVAVSTSGSANSVMTSPDGITWTIRTGIASGTTWNSICYGNGLFVAVSSSGTGNRVMTSPDGITWTSRTSAADNGWINLCYGNGLFVAVAVTSGINNQVMTSPDGITWTSRTSAANNSWYGLCYGNGLFVATSYSTSSSSVMTSPDGITWTSRTSPSSSSYNSICYGNGLFISPSSSGDGNMITSGFKIESSNYNPTQIISTNITTGSVGIGNVSPSALLTLGTAGYRQGQVSFAGSTSGTLTMQPPAAVTSYTLTLPSSAGSANGVLVTNGSGTTSFSNAITQTTVTSGQFRLSALNTAPATATATGTLGEIRIVNGFIYVCIATNSWQRVALAAW